MTKIFFYRHYNSMMNYDLAKLSYDFYKYGSEGKKLWAWHSIGQFFDAAEGTNPCTARMHLQYSLNSVLSEGVNDYSEGYIREGKFKKITLNTAELTGRLVQDERFKALNNMIKEMYPKTYKKRLSILSYLIDNSILGRVSVSDNKKEKVSQYIARKLMFWT